MAASDPTPYVATPTGTLQGVAAFSWDGSAWQPTAGAGPDVATPTGVLRGVAPFAWDGAAWQPSGRAQPGVAALGGVLDGVAVYTWSGSAWTPTGGTATPSTPSGALRGVAAFSWDGSNWQPAAQARSSVATPYGVLDGVAVFNWGGSTWQAGAAVPAGATLDLSFLSGALDPRITFGRASVGTYFDAAGVMQTATTNAPRFDYDPATHALRGLLIEEARTNVLLNSAALGTQSATVTAQAYTLSFYGTGTITKSGTAAGALVGTGAFPQRVSQTFTPTAGTLTLTVTGSVLSAQLEAGAFPTSYIPTIAAAVTRSADVCQMPVGAWFTPNTFSMYSEYYQLNTPGGGMGGFGDNAFGDNVWYFSSNGLNKIGTNQGTANFQSITVLGAVNKMCGTFATTGIRTALNGTAVGTYAAALVAPSGALRLSVGDAPWSPGATPFNCHARRVRVWPRVLSDAELQSVTT